MPSNLIYMQAHCHSRNSVNRLSGEGAFHRVLWPVERRVMKVLMMSPGQLAKLAKKKHVNFIAVTDHNTVPDLSEDSLIPGEEWGQTKGHANFINIEKPIDPESGYFRNSPPDNPKDFFTAVYEARKQGAFVSINHPFKRDSWLWGEESYRLANSIEIWNGAWSEENFLALQQWQSLLVRGIKIFCMAGNDFHVNHIFDISSQVLAFRNVQDRESLIANLMKGNYSITKNTDSPVVFLDGDLNYTIEKYSVDTKLRIISATSSSTISNPDKEGNVTSNNGEKFIRLELWDKYGPLSFTNPIFL
jgi:hypothetical protein